MSFLRYRAIALILLACCIIGTKAHGANINFPELSGRVLDKGNFINASVELELSEQLKQHEEKAGNQIVVVTLENLQGRTIEDFGYQLGRYWGIGQKDKNNGVLLIVARQERKMRIEVGYGLEGQLTDAIASQIIHRIIRPQFKLGNFSKGIQKGTLSIIAALDGNYIPPKKPHSQKNNKKSSGALALLIIAVILFSFIGSFFGGGRGGRGGGGFYIGGSSSSFGGGFSSGGGFSGGGGSFGGGGASGGW